MSRRSGTASSPASTPPRASSASALKHGPKLEILATNKLSEGIDATPVLVGKQIFLRGEKHLYCVEE